MKQQSRKAKGRRLQNYVRDKILKNFPHLKAKDVQCVENYAPGPDIILSKVGLRLCPYQWEIKNQEKMKTIYDWFKQANKKIPKKLSGVLVMKMNTRDPLVVIDFEHFLELIKE